MKRIAAVLMAMLVLFAAGQQPASAADTGKITSVSAINAAVTVAGVTSATTLAVTIDGPVKGRVRVNPGKAFSVRFIIPTGTHTVCFLGGTVSLGCVKVTVLALATAANFAKQRDQIDPKHTEAWTLTAPTWSTSLGSTQPWNHTVRIDGSVPEVNLRSVMLHEWSHVLQYRAKNGDWWAAVGHASAVYGYPATDRNYTHGTEQEADCMAQVMGGTFHGYGGCQTGKVPDAQAVIIAGRASSTV